MSSPDVVLHPLGALGCPSAAHPFAWLLLVTPLVDCFHVALQTISPSCLVDTLGAVENFGPVVFASNMFLERVTSRGTVVTIGTNKDHGESCMLVFVANVLL